MTIILMILTSFLIIGCEGKGDGGLGLVNHGFSNVRIILNTDIGDIPYDATVSIKNNDDSSIYFSTKASSNTAVFSNVPFGSYTLTITHTWYEPYINNSLSVQSRIVSYSPTINALLSNVTVNITTNIGSPVHGASVTIQNNVIDSIDFSTTSSNNTANFTNVPYGTYTLTITHPMFEMFTNNFTVQLETVSTPAHLTAIIYVIGSIGPAGGIVFYDKGSYTDGWSYLEAAPANYEFNAEWGAYGHDITGTQITYGSGRSNTELIIARLTQLGETDRAAQRCQVLNINGFNDWFLPSRNELDLMYKIRNTIGDFSNTWYWSSSQMTANTTWLQNFANGNQNFSTKNNTQRVRAIRAF